MIITDTSEKSVNIKYRIPAANLNIQLLGEAIVIPGECNIRLNCSLLQLPIHFEKYPVDRPKERSNRHFTFGSAHRVGFTNTEGHQKFGHTSRRYPNQVM